MSGPRKEAGIRTGLDTNTAFAMLDLSAALAAQHERPLDLTRTLPGRLVWYPRNLVLEPMEPTELKRRIDAALDVNTAIRNGDAR